MWRRTKEGKTILTVPRLILNVGLAKDLRDPAFAREFLLAAIDEGVDLQLALGKVIRAMGVKELAFG